MGSPFLYFADDRLSLAELSAARLDGHLIEVDSAYMPADTIETRHARAGSLRPLLRGLMAATHLTAAWVHGALPDPPGRHTVQRAVDRRIHGVIHRRLHYRDLRVDPTDLQRIGGVDVTTPVRTVADVARVSDGAHRAALAGLLSSHPELAAQAIRWLEEAGTLPHKVAALRVLAQWPRSREDESLVRGSG